jgi:hypothetical protein
VFDLASENNSFQFAGVQARMAKVMSSLMLHTTPPRTTFYLTAEKIVRSLDVSTSLDLTFCCGICFVVKHDHNWTIIVCVCEKNRILSCKFTSVDCFTNPSGMVDDQ